MKNFKRKFIGLLVLVFTISFSVNAQDILFDCYLDFTGPSECISPELEEGNYILELSGTFCSGSCWGGNTSDAAFNINHPYADNPGIPQPISPWTWNQYCPQDDNSCEGFRPTNDEYNPEHVYYYNFSTNGGVESIFGISDECCWWDNSGGLIVRIYQDLDSIVLGCTDPTAINYDETANENDDSCLGNQGLQTINVPNDYSTIQEAIDASSDGDTIMVSPGIYYENDITFNGKKIVLLSSEGPDNTIIDGNDNGRIFDITQGESFDTEIIGFTIQNGNHSTGSAIRIINDSYLTVKNCIVQNNNAPGIWTRAAVTIGHEYNNGPHTPAGAKFINTSFINNSGYYGAAVFNEESGEQSSEFIECIFDSNNGYHGAAIFGTRNSIIRNCIFIDNYSNGPSNAIMQNGNPQIINSVFYNNQSYVLAGNSSLPSQITNCISTNNYGFINLSETDVDLIQVSYSNIEGGYEGEGNIDTDPLFVNAEIDDFSLQEGSPCIDAGNPNSQLDPDSTIADIGAIYFHQNNLLDTIVLDDINLLTDSIVSVCDLPQPYAGNTGSSMNVFLTEEVFTSFPTLLPDAYIIALNQANMVVGGSSWSARPTWLFEEFNQYGQSMLAIWGDDSTTDEIDGALLGEEITFQLVNGNMLYDLNLSFEINWYYITNSTVLALDANVTFNCSTNLDTTLGCTNPMAINFYPNANLDDGSCLLIGCSDSTYLEYYNQGFIPSINDTQNNEVFCQNVAIFGCMDQAACNYSPNVNVDDYSCLYSNDGFDCDNNFVSMSCNPFHEYNGYHDNFFGVHPSFSFENNETIINISQGEINYTFQVVGSGGYSEGGCNVNYVYLPGDLSDIFGSPFFDGARIEVYTDGCTDPAAINYNENADIDFHGSCLFSGCMSEWADNYDSFAYEDDGSCYREGCTSDWADNYDSLATINNNSCTIQLNEQEYEAVLTNNSLISSLQEQIDNLSYIESQYNVVLNAYSIIEEQLEQCQPDAYGQISLELKEGWNMIGYNLIFPSNMVEQLLEIESDINVIKDNNGNFYWPSFGFNGIGNFTPGHGYLIKMYNDRDFIFEP